MRVLVICHGFPPRAQGGSEIYAFEHARALARRGHEVLVATREQDASRPERAVRRDIHQGISIVWVNNTFADTLDFADSYEHPRLCEAVLPHIDDFAPEVAHAHHLTCLSTRLIDALANRRVPIVYTLHDYWLMCHRGQLLNRTLQVCQGPGSHGCGNCIEAPGKAAGTLKRTGLAKLATRALPAGAIERIGAAARRMTPQAREDCTSLEGARLAHMRDVCEGISHFLAPSRHMREAFVAFGIPPERITLSPYGFDHSQALVGSRADRRARPLKLGFIGTLMVSKGPDVLLDAVAQLPPGSVEVHIYGAVADYHGDRTYGDHLRDRLTAPGIHVHGPRPHGEVRRGMAVLDALVVPSIWPENSPLVIQEALIAGVPVIASRTGGITELITEGENGLVFEPGDRVGLAAILARLVDDPNALDRLRANGSRVRTIEDDVRHSEELYQRLVASRQAARVAPHVAAIVVHHRTPEQTSLTLRALRASTERLGDIVVVNNDNDEGDPRLRLLSSAWLNTGGNLGFSGGVNVGVREALRRGATHVLLVNSDVMVPPNTLAQLMTALEQTRAAGIAVPVTAELTRPDVVESAGIDYSRRSGRMRLTRCGERLKPASESVSTTIDAGTACVMLIRSEVFRAIGLFEEAYFYGYEDIDFCLRARHHGFATVLAAGAVVHHQGAQSIGQGSPLRLYFGARNQLLLASRVSGHDAWLTRATRNASIVALNLAHASKNGAIPASLAAVIKGVADYASGRFGPGR